jgi:hypothetical protein
VSRKVIAAILLMTGTLLFSAGAAVVPAKLGDVGGIITATSPALGALASATTTLILLSLMGIVSAMMVLWRLFSR